jgi:hypothetical protein
MPRKPKPVTDNERLQRRLEIGKTVYQAMSALSAKKQMEWTRETPETSAAGVKLDNAMADFIEGVATREDVKKVYKVFADLHTV